MNTDKTEENGNNEEQGHKHWFRSKATNIGSGAGPQTFGSGMEGRASARPYGRECLDRLQPLKQLFRPRAEGFVCLIGFICADLCSSVDKSPRLFT
jgi:hypothetical protein